ncbi:hypothetical protein P7K49_028560 [Saguinus oedipus]|uniref:Uncharacterized protein n=1 Tax=Saguinus oedipus TaxID=9490 RepID=A0ABQ9U6N9_SAGOE|nr:hypothetical protein P7K49_028560 [Saguinus oedipus]
MSRSLTTVSIGIPAECKGDCTPPPIWDVELDTVCILRKGIVAPANTLEKYSQGISRFLFGCLWSLEGGRDPGQGLHSALQNQLLLENSARTLYAAPPTDTPSARLLTFYLQASRLAYL